MDGEPRWLSLNGKRYAEFFASTAVAADVVLVFDASLVPQPSVFRRLQQRVTPRRSGPFRVVAQITHGIDMVVAAGPGSPAASVTIELLAALGAKRVISVGTAAATSDEIDDGELCLIGDATLAAAMSPYGTAATPDRPLFEPLHSRVDKVVPAVTTLWPFRVDANEVASQPGAVIEMEAATLHAVGHTVGVAIESLVVISDRYTDGQWQLGDVDTTRKSLNRAVDAAVAVLCADQ